MKMRPDFFACACILLMEIAQRFSAGTFNRCNVEVPSGTKDSPEDEFAAENPPFLIVARTRSAMLASVQRFALRSPATSGNRPQRVALLYNILQHNSR